MTALATAAGTASIRHTVRVRRDVQVVEDTDRPGVLLLSGVAGSASLGPLATGVARAAEALADGWHTEEELSRMTTTTERESAVLALQMVLRRLDGAGLLEHRVGDVSGCVVLRQTGRGGIGPLPVVDRSGTMKLSRFAVVRAVDGRPRLEAPRSHLVVDLEGDAVGIVAHLADWTSGTDPVLVARWGETGVAAVLGLLDLAGVLVVGGPDDDPEDKPAWAPWSAEDLWVHARSQGPTTTGSYGGTYPLRGRLAPWPAISPSTGGRRLALPEPADDERGSELTLREVMRRRRSVRAHDDEHPIGLGELGTLLGRSVRTTATYPAEDHEICSRPHPGGGALYELEIYPVVTSCRGVEPGVWRYDAHAHALERVADPSRHSLSLVETARTAALMERPPQVLMVVTARFGRVMWKYEGMAYALILKHVGVVYQTLYLVATALGLAPCALGGGDAEAFARASGLDYGLEGSVGQFIVGSRPASAPTDFWPPPTP